MKTLKQFTEGKKHRKLKSTHDLLDAMDDNRIFFKYYSPPSHGDGEVYDDVPIKLITKHFGLTYKGLSNMDDRTRRQDRDMAGADITLPFKNTPDAKVTIRGVSTL